MKTFYIYECDSASCRGELYAVTEQPLSCPYCDSTAMDEKPKFVITGMSYDLYRNSPLKDAVEKHRDKIGDIAEKNTVRNEEGLTVAEDE